MPLPDIRKSIRDYQKKLEKNEITPDNERTLAPSTIHRWVGALGKIKETGQKALDLLTQEDPGSTICRDLAQLKMPARKYRSQRRGKLLVGCLSLLIIEKFFGRRSRTPFSPSWQ